MTDGRPSAAPARPVVEADLQVRVTDSAGSTGRVAITGGEDGVRVDVDRPEVVMASLPAWPRAADGLGATRALGVRVEVHGPRGRLAVLDPDRPSRLAGLLTGEPALRVAPAAVGAWARGPGRRPLLAAVAALAAAAVLAAVAFATTSRRASS